MALWAYSLQGAFQVHYFIKSPPLNLREVRARSYYSYNKEPKAEILSHMAKVIEQISGGAWT